MESKEIMQIDNNYPFEDFIDKNKKLLKELEKKKNRKLRMHTVTFGCQMNVVRLILKLHKKGHRPIYI